MGVIGLDFDVSNAVDEKLNRRPLLGEEHGIEFGGHAKLRRFYSTARRLASTRSSRDSLFCLSVGKKTGSKR